MAKKPEQMDPNEKIAGLLKKLIIIQLSLAGVGQAQIRKIVGGSMGEINSIAKLVQPKKKGTE